MTQLYYQSVSTVSHLVRILCIDHLTRLKNNHFPDPLNLFKVKTNQYVNFYLGDVIFLLTIKGQCSASESFLTKDCEMNGIERALYGGKENYNT